MILKLVLRFSKKNSEFAIPIFILDYFTSGTVFDLLGYAVPLKTPTLPDICFPSILLFLDRVAKGNASFKY